MAQKGSCVSTPYFELMRDAVSRLVGEGYDAFNQDALAETMGKKKTSAFRARLEQLVCAGELVSWSYWTGKGIGKAYCRPVSKPQLPGFTLDVSDGESFR